MLHPPLSVFAAAPAPNYVDPVQHSTARMAIAAIFIPIVTVTVALRIWTRWKITKSFGIDDALIIAALIPTLAFNLSIIVIDAAFLGRRHSYDIPLPTASAALKMFLAAQILFSLASPLIKFSLLYFYHRLLRGTNYAHPLCRTAIWVSIAFNGGATLSYFFTVLFGCRPIRASWDIFPDYAYFCISDSSIIVFGILNAVTDFVVLGLPIPIVWSLQLPVETRAAVIALFSLSALACAAGILRTVYSAYWADSYDLSWNTWALGVAAMVELNLGIICASAPALKPLVKRFVPRLLEVGSSVGSEGSELLKGKLVKLGGWMARVKSLGTSGSSTIDEELGEKRPSVEVRQDRRWYKGWS